MNDDRLIRDIRALDRAVEVDPAFADRLYERLRAERRRRFRQLPFMLLAAALLAGASVTALIMAGGTTEAPEALAPIRHTWYLELPRGQLGIEYALPEDVDLTVSEARTYLAFTAESSRAYTFDGQGTPILPAARGLKITNVAGATAHYSNGLPVGIDAASFLSGLASHPVLDLEVGEITRAVVGGRPAVAADVRPRNLQRHLDQGTFAHLDQGQVSIDIWPQGRLIVADVGRAIVLVQIWAGSEEALHEWLPQAERLVDSIRFSGGS